MSVLIPGREIRENAWKCERDPNAPVEFAEAIYSIRTLPGLGSGLALLPYFHAFGPPAIALIP